MFCFFIGIFHVVKIITVFENDKWVSISYSHVVLNLGHEALVHYTSFCCSLFLECYLCIVLVTCSGLQVLQCRMMLCRFAGCRES